MVLDSKTLGRCLTIAAEPRPQGGTGGCSGQVVVKIGAISHFFDEI